MVLVVYVKLFPMFFLSANITTEDIWETPQCKQQNWIHKTGTPETTLRFLFCFVFVLCFFSFYQLSRIVIIFLLSNYIYFKVRDDVGYMPLYLQTSIAVNQNFSSKKEFYFPQIKYNSSYREQWHTVVANTVRKVYFCSLLWLLMVSRTPTKLSPGSCCHALLTPY